MLRKKDEDRNRIMKMKGWGIYGEITIEVAVVKN